MDRYNREERGRFGGEPTGGEPEPSGAPGDFPWEEGGTGEQAGATRTGGESGPSGAPEDFPWQDEGGAERPPPVWEEPPAEPSAAFGGGLEPQGNPLAITGFILSLVMWITIFVPPLSFVVWVLALTFSSIGLSRARKRGAPHKGLAVAGLCISLIGVVLVVLFVLVVIGAAAFAP